MGHLLSRINASASGRFGRPAFARKRAELQKMSNLDTRQVNRDSLFLLAHVRLVGQVEGARVKVRNLSAGGMMAEGEMKVSRGSLVEVELRNIGWVEGSVAWKQDDRFGIAFVEEIDPKLARAPVAADSRELASPRFTRTANTIPPTVDPQMLRKI